METTARKHAQDHPSVKELAKQDGGRGRIKDYGGKYGVSVEWNPRMSKDRVFALHIERGTGENITVYLDIDELMWYTRLV